MKRIYKSWLGIPIWVITGISLFFIFSVGYDLIVGDISTSRTILLIGSSVILLITLLLHSIKLSTLSRVARRQLGG